MNEPVSIYIDCEFNGWMGELISFAMVADDGREFYEVLPSPLIWDKWCYENVLPVRGPPTVESFEEFRTAFLEFLGGFQSPTIIADWPADLFYFFKILLGETGHEATVSIPCQARLVNCDIVSPVPHNALADAWAIRDALSKSEAAA